jgi:hypothetical protein
VNWFWHTVWLCLVVIPAAILWIVCIIDVVFNRGDLVWWKRLAYLGLVLIPFIGAIIYIGVTPRLRHPEMGFESMEATTADRPMVARPPGTFMG